jgi:hypothetical protein
MASILQQTLARLKSYVTTLADSTRDESGAAQPFVFGSDIDASSKKALPCSIVKMQDGTFLTVPHKRGSQFGASGAKLFGCASGDLHGRASEIDISAIDGIALGVLSDFSAADVVGANAAGLQAVGGVAARLAPVVHTPFT